MAPNYLVYGTGLSGLGALRTLLAAGEKVVLYDDKEHLLPAEITQLLEAKGGKYYCGTLPEAELEQITCLVLSPGVPLSNELVERARAKGIEVIGEAELAYRRTPCAWIGITGTNGKTTTTTLLGEMMRSLPCKTVVAGNIGESLSLATRELSAADYVVAELSSFQLESAKLLRGHIALILNITPDHLERHHTMEAYIAAKKNIYRRQKPGDVLVLNYDDPLVRSFAKDAPAKVCFFSRSQEISDGVYIAKGNFVISIGGKVEVVCPVKEMKIFGAHNEENALGAIACAYYAGVSPSAMAETLRTFEGVEHRLEYVATLKGVPYYNDSKATNTDSTIKALEAFQQPIVLIAGGHDKLTDLTAMMKLVKEKVSTLILLGEAKERFHKAARYAGVTKIFTVDTFDAAVSLAYTEAKEGEVVLLSPACSSYDMFANFPQRGRYFKKLVHALACTASGRGESK